MTLVLGPANSGKMGLALRWCQERLSCRPVFVVPTGPDTVNLNLEMVRRAGALIAQSPTVTFDGLVALVLGSRPHYLSGFQREIVLQRLLQETPVPSLEGAAALPGTASALGGLLLELEESGEHPGQLEKAFNHWRDSRALGKSLAEDLARLLPAYAAAKAELGATDRPIAVIEATARVGAQAEVRSGKQRGGQGGAWDRPVICYGFTSFTPGQRRLLHAIAAGAPVLVTLPYERGREINLTSDSEFQEWERAAERIVEMGPPPLDVGSYVPYYVLISGAVAIVCWLLAVNIAIWKLRCTGNSKGRSSNATPVKGEKSASLNSASRACAANPVTATAKTVMKMTFIQRAVCFISFSSSVAGMRESRR